ncbi:MAG: glycosyltransferase family 4 protein [Pseudomonadota bacterium]
MSTDQGPGKVIFVNRFFYPDHGATAQILSDLASHLTDIGFEVEVVTSRLSYSNPDERFEPREQWNGVSIVRLPTTGFGRANLIGRTLDYLSFYVVCFFSILKRAKRNDTVIIKTDPPLLSVPIGFVTRLKRARMMNWLQDLFPEVAGALGMKLARGPAGAFLRALRNRSLRRADLNIAIGERMAELLRENRVAPERIRVIQNFSDDDSVRPDPPEWQLLRKAWGYRESDFVIGYSGNLGRAHDVETLLGAAEILKNQSDIRFLFVGGGHLKQQVETVAETRGLTSIDFKPYQPREKLAQSLSVPDIHWISLLPELEGLIVPSKLYGVAAVGRPVLMIGDKDGEIGRLAQRHGFGVCVGIGENQHLAEQILAFARDPKRVEKLGQAARAFIDAEASRKHCFQQWEDVLKR